MSSRPSLPTPLVAPPKVAIAPPGVAVPVAVGTPGVAIPVALGAPPVIVPLPPPSVVSSVPAFSSFDNSGFAPSTLDYPAPIPPPGVASFPQFGHGTSSSVYPSAGSFSEVFPNYVAPRKFD